MLRPKWCVYWTACKSIILAVIRDFLMNCRSWPVEPALKSLWCEGRCELSVCGVKSAHWLMPLTGLSTSQWSVVSGHWSVVNGHWSVICGHWSVVSGQWSVVSGHWSLVTGQWSVVSGHWSVICGQRSVVSGQWSVVSGHWSVVCGQWSVVCGQWSVICGHWSVVSDLWSVVSGHWSLICGQRSVVTGHCVCVCVCDRSGRRTTAKSRSVWRSCCRLGLTSTSRRCCSRTSAAWLRSSKTVRSLLNVATSIISRLRRVSDVLSSSTVYIDVLV